MAEDPEQERLRALGERLSRARKADPARSQAGQGLGAAEVAWRMVIELVVGICLGLAIGYGLDLWLGTRPILMVVFVLLGFVAGIRTVLGTAAELQRKQAGQPADDERD